MSTAELDHPDFDKWLSLSEKAIRKETVNSDDRFIALMHRAVDAGREQAAFGVFVDATPPTCVIRVRSAVPASACGSPGAMCIEGEGSAGGRRKSYNLG